MRLLIVDDHVLFREGLAAILRAEPDIEILGLAGGVAEAVALARETKPDIILMDFQLPDGSGVDATTAILAEQPSCKIIFLTVYENDDKLIAAVRAGAKGYLLKTMRPAKLVAALRSVIKGESAVSRVMTLRLMDELTRTKASVTKAASALSLLTHREQEVLRLLAGNATNNEIATKLFLSENTVRYHVHSILEKLSLPGRKEAGDFARQQGVAR